MAEVLYSDVRFTKRKREASEDISSSADTTYSEIKISKNPTSTTEPNEGSQQAILSRRSKVTSERVALLVLSALLVAAVVALGVTAFEHMRTKETLEKLKTKWESLNTNLSETEKKMCSTVHPTCLPCPEVKKINPLSTVQPMCPQCPEVKNEPCSKCEDGWEQHGGKCYFFSSGKSSWNESRDNCTNKGGDLVKIDSKEEQTFLGGKLINIMNASEDKFWIGLTDSAGENRWLWVDGSPLDESLKFWSGNEPDNWEGENPAGEDCARMGEKAEAPDLRCWFDKSCTVPHRSICEKQEITGQLRPVCF